MNKHYLQAVLVKTANISKEDLIDRARRAQAVVDTPSRNILIGGGLASGAMFGKKLPRVVRMGLGVAGAGVMARGLIHDNDQSRRQVAEYYANKAGVDPREFAQGFPNG